MIKKGMNLTKDQRGEVQQCWVIQAIKHTQIYVVRQLAYSTELLVCINQAWKQYKQQNKEEEKKFSTQLNSP
jgi:hypothetical protein